MTARIPTPCTFMDASGPCPEYAVNRARCAQHQRKAWAHDRSPRDRGYDEKWRRLSSAYRRRHPKCEVQGCEAKSEETDHIIPLSQGGARLDPANLQALCKTHHQEKTTTEAQYGRMKP